VIDVEKDRQSAEIFDALGHPTRIAILKALNQGPMGFADLKKKISIDSSGQRARSCFSLFLILRS
jgi:DNA-binding transcriptional ArsR family regulator